MVTYPKNNRPPCKWCGGPTKWVCMPNWWGPRCVSDWTNCLGKTRDAYDSKLWGCYEI